MELKSNSHTLIGFQVKPFEKEPDFLIHRFKIYRRGKAELLTPSEQKLNHNYQVDGSPNEKLIIRIYFKPDGTCRKVRFYSLFDFDPEIAEYVTKALLLKLKIPNEQIEIIDFKYMSIQ